MNLRLNVYMHNVTMHTFSITIDKLLLLQFLKMSYIQSKNSKNKRKLEKNENESEQIILFNVFKKM